MQIKGVKKRNSQGWSRKNHVEFPRVLDIVLGISKEYIQHKFWKFQVWSFILSTTSWGKVTNLNFLWFCQKNIFSTPYLNKNLHYFVWNWLRRYRYRRNKTMNGPLFFWNFQVFKEDLALWVALVYDTWSNNSQYNNAQFMYI